jgi:hypothetical protein
MGQAEPELCHRDPPFQAPASGVEQAQTSQQPPPPRPVVGLLGMDLARRRRNRGFRVRQAWSLPLRRVQARLRRGAVRGVA